MGFLSFFSFSSCDSEMPIEYATHRESEEKSGCKPKAMILVVPSAMLVTRSSLL
jgi:hypothetical protein